MVSASKSSLSSNIGELEFSFKNLDIPFNFPVSHSLKTRRKTEAFIVILKKADFIGYGEATPRKYATYENIEECLKILEDLRGNIHDIIKESIKKYPSISCALECAYLDLIGKINKKPVYKFFSNRELDFEYSGVIPLEKTGIDLLKKFKIKHIKIKVGRNTDPKEIYEFEKKYKPRSLRLDANAAFDLNEALEFSKGLDISAFEQPIKTNDLDGLRIFEEKTRIPVIADESYSLENISLFLNKKFCSGINLRLSKCGGISNLLSFYNIAKKNNMLILLGSHVGETSILSALQYHTALCRKFDFIEGGYSSIVLKDDVADFKFSRYSKDIRLNNEGLGLRVSI